MNVFTGSPPVSELPRRRKAAMIVQMLIGDGEALSLDQLPESLQLALTRELGSLRRIDRDTVAAVAEEFTAELEAIGMTAPGTHDAAVNALADHLSPQLAQQLRSQLESVRNGDHWPVICALPIKQLVVIMEQESIEVCAVALSKLPVAQAAEVLSKTPGPRARRITYAMSLTSDIAPAAVQRIGAALAADYGTQAALAFEKAPVQRLGAILNSTNTDTREAILASLNEEDPPFASDVRKAIFTFKDIAPRVKPTDIPSCTRSLDTQVLTTAIAAGLAGDAAHVASAEFILASMSQRMATQLREDAQDLGKVKKDDAEAALSEVTKAIRELVDGGIITLLDPDHDETDDAPA